jgi:hypothetical protein
MPRFSKENAAIYIIAVVVIVIVVLGFYGYFTGAWQQ